MRDLGRVNLLVGRNNSGKTSVLEALYVLGTDGDPASLWRICDGRGEVFRDDRMSNTLPDADISHLFSGHCLSLGEKFSVTGQSAVANGATEVSVSVEDRQLRPAETDGQILEPLLGIRIIGVASRRKVQLSVRGGLKLDAMFTDDLDRRAGQGSPPVRFISTAGVSVREMVRLWDEVQLVGQESLVVEMLKTIDASIEDIRSLASARTNGPREGFVVRYANDTRRLPLGSMGDGVWRILTLAITMARSARGVLLVDEIDTGLHHTVMSDMWRLLYAAAKRLDIQIFATTHSEDCVYSLASICSDDEDAGDVTIQRIDAGRAKSVAYSEAEIRAAAEHRIEVR